MGTDDILEKYLNQIGGVILKNKYAGFKPGNKKPLKLVYWWFPIYNVANQVVFSMLGTLWCSPKCVFDSFRGRCATLRWVSRRIDVDQREG